MKALYAVLLALVLGVGCGKGTAEKSAAKEPELRSEKVITPDEAANELFVEAVELVSEAQSKETTDFPAAIKSYEQALVKVREITNKHKKSSLAVKLVSDEALLKGKTMAQIEERVKELCSKDHPIVELKIRKAAYKPTDELSKADYEKVTSLLLMGKKLTELPKGLEKLTRLRLLFLDNNQLTSVKGLEKLTQLETLILSDNQLTDVKSLEKLTQLETLWLNGNQLTDVKGLEKLAQLTKLDLEHNPALTKAQIAELQKALPKCYISSNYNSGSPEPKTAP